jgi:hypothetical protein
MDKHYKKGTFCLEEQKKGLVNTTGKQLSYKMGVTPTKP